MYLKLADKGCPHYKCWVTFDYLEDCNKLFKVRDLSRLGSQNDIDFCVYFVYDGAGRIVYIGKGRYWSYIKYGETQGLKSRPFTHYDFLSSNIDSSFKIAIIHCGLTDIEAQLLEAYYLFLQYRSNRTLTEGNAEKGDRVSLINKKFEMYNKDEGFLKLYKLAKIYLNDYIWKSLKTYC